MLQSFFFFDGGIHVSRMVGKGKAILWPEALAPAEIAVSPLVGRA
jgi:hypothetical protein